jgi:photosystem II stability/assembly factor-like uncharacterized protein
MNAYGSANMIKVVFFLILFLNVLPSVVAQSMQKLPELYPVDSSQTFYDIQKKFNDYWDQYNVKDGYYIENGKKTKAANWKLFKRWEWFWENRINQVTGEFPTTNSVIEYEKSKNKLNKITAFNENWVNLGTSSSTGGYAGIGRINCVAFHPSDANTFWVGSPSGGIWKTVDGGSNWTILNNNETVLGVSDIAITSDYATSQTLYIATGDRDGGSMWSLGGGQSADNVSIGVLKSTDGGSTWVTTGLSFTKSSGVQITRLLIDPTNNQILFASTKSGVYKTTDGGSNWILKSGNIWIDMEFKPGDHNTIYGSLFGNYGNAYTAKSTDNGESWTYISFGTGGYRTEIAVSPNAPNVVYALVCNLSGGLLGVYISTDSGSTFSQVNTNTSQNMLGYYSDGSGGTSGQGSYDLCIAVSPTDANTVFIGGVNTWKSTDGGVTWTISNMWTSYFVYNKSGAPVAHADKHALVFQSGSVLFEGNDGGVYKTTNGGSSWTDLSNGLVISQIYRIGVSQTSSTTILTGLQDNGSKKYSGSWTDVKGGDGMECIVDYSNISYMYATYVRGQITRSSNGFATYGGTDISANIPGGQPTGAWVTPYIMDPTNASTLYAGYDKIWKTTDRGNNWTTASQTLSSSNKLRSLAIAPSNTSILYAADLTSMWKTTDGGSTNWTDISSTLPINTNSITYIAVHATDPNKVWITYGGYTDLAKVYESTDGGSSWTNISTGLPNLPVMSIVHYKTITDKTILFVGTDLGVYVKDGTADWAAYNTGLPNVVVAELEIFYDSGGGTDKLRAGTFGRGLWETEIVAPLPVELTSFTGMAIGNDIKLKWTTATEVNNFGFEIERSSSSSNPGYNEWEIIGFVEGNGNSNSPKSYSFIDSDPIGSNIFSYRLKQIDNDGRFEYSNEVEVRITLTEFALFQNYPNPFNPSTTISYSLANSEMISIKVYDIIGNEVAELVNKYQQAGNYNISFDASNLPSGIFFYSIKAGSFFKTRKMILLK